MKNVMKAAFLSLCSLSAVPVWANDVHANAEVGAVVENHDDDDVVDYYQAQRYAYLLADQAEQLAMRGGCFGGVRRFSEVETASATTDTVLPESHSNIRYAAENLHQAASRLFHLLRRMNMNMNGGMNREDHRDDPNPVAHEFDDVQMAYERLVSLGDGSYAVMQIGNTFATLRSILFR